MSVRQSGIYLLLFDFANNPFDQQNPPCDGRNLNQRNQNCCDNKRNNLFLGHSSINAYNIIFVDAAEENDKDDYKEKIIEVYHGIFTDEAGFYHLPFFEAISLLGTDLLIENED